jgi:hypothetical protein
MALESNGTERAFLVLVALYLGAIVSANAMAAKLFVVFGVQVTAGALAIPIVYLSTDLLNELYGAKATIRVVYMGLLASVVLVAMSLLGQAMPAASYGASQQEFEAVFAVTWRVTLASCIAYLLSSLLDVWLFKRLRELTAGRLFWLRKNGSTFVSQFVDTGLFIALAFSFTMPWRVLGAMWLGQYLVKVSAAPLGTPLSYLILKIAKR